MKSPFVKTICFALLAALVSSIAAAYYPWPERVVESEMVGKPLFEPYDTSAVFKIRILEFDRDKESLEQITLERKGEKWTIPASNKFVANNATQIAVVAKSLNELTVLSEESSDSEAFLDKGVVDPSKYESTTDRSALGTKLILEDHKGRRIASLIVGSSLKDEDNSLKNHFVRVPGQPTVYQVEFNKSSLATDFTRWVDPDLFGFKQRAPSVAPGVIGIDDYRVTPAGPGSESGMKRNYEAEFQFTQGGLGISKFAKQDSAGKLQEYEPSQSLARQFAAIGGQLGNIKFHDVRKKPAKLAKAMRQPTTTVEDSVFEPLKEIGFVKKGYQEQSFDFEAVGGEVYVRHGDGVKVTLHIGDVATGTISDNLRVSLHVMVTAGVDESIFETPQTPEDPKDKEYLRKLKERNDAIKAASIRATGLNQLHANWIYLVPEDVIENIRPDIEIGDAQPIADDSAEVSQDKPAEEKVEEKAEEPEAANSDSN